MRPTGSGISIAGNMEVGTSLVALIVRYYALKQVAARTGKTIG